MAVNDWNDDGVINDDDKQIYGCTDPKWTGSLSSSIWDIKVLTSHLCFIPNKDNGLAVISTNNTKTIMTVDVKDEF